MSNEVTLSRVKMKINLDPKEINEERKDFDDFPKLT